MRWPGLVSRRSKQLLRFCSKGGKREGGCLFNSVGSAETSSRVPSPHDRNVRRAAEWSVSLGWVSSMSIPLES